MIDIFKDCVSCSDKRKKILLVFTGLLFIFMILFSFPDLLFGYKYHFQYKRYGDMTLYYFGGIMINSGVPDIYNKEKFEKFFTAIPDIKEKHSMLNYPPLIYVLFSLVGKVPLPIVGNIWFILNILFLISTVVLIFYANPAGGLSDKHKILRYVLYGIYVLLFAPTLCCLLQGQINIFLLLLAAGAYLALKKGKSDLAGFLIGIAAAIKILPGIIFIYFLIRKDWKALSTGIITILIIYLGIALIVSPDIVSGYALNTSGPLQSVPSIYEWISSTNQSIPVTITRIFSENSLNSPWINAPFLVKPLRILSALAFLATLLFTLIKLTPRAKDKKEKNYIETDGKSIDFLFPLCLCAQFVLSPLVWFHHQILFLLGIPIIMEYIIAIKNIDRKTFFLSIFFILIFWTTGTFNGTASSMTRPVAGYIRFIYTESLIPNFLVIAGWIMMMLMSFRFIGSEETDNSSVDKEDKING